MNFAHYGAEARKVMNDDRDQSDAQYDREDF
jgi:hypothetical protein